MSGLEDAGSDNEEDGLLDEEELFEAKLYQKWADSHPPEPAAIEEAAPAHKLYPDRT